MCLYSGEEKHLISTLIQMFTTDWKTPQKTEMFFVKNLFEQFLNRYADGFPIRKLTTGYIVCSKDSIWNNQSLRNSKKIPRNENHSQQVKFDDLFCNIWSSYNNNTCLLKFKLSMCIFFSSHACKGLKRKIGTF